MKELFVSYELALLAKEKGFKESCLGHFDENKLLFPSVNTISTIRDITEDEKFCNEYPHDDENVFIDWNPFSPDLAAPLYQQLVDFLNCNGFALQYGKVDLSLINKQLKECLEKLESIK